MSPEQLPDRHLRCSRQARLAGALVAVSLCVIDVGEVHAQPATSAAEQAIKANRTADEYADLAAAAYRRGDYKAALAQYRNAYNAAARPLFLFNMARCLEKLGRYGEAAEHMREYLRRYRIHHGQVPGNQDRVLSLIKVLQERQTARRAKVVVGSNPPGATVTRVDTGASLGVTPLKLRLKAGIYKLRLDLQDHEPLDADLEVPESEKVRAVFTLKPIRERAAITVWVNVRRAKIELDGKVVAVSPFTERVQVRPGRHVLRVSKRGYEPYEEIVDVPRDRLMEISYVLQPETSMVTWRSWVGAGVAAAGLGGLGGGLAASTAADRFYVDSSGFSQLQTYQNVGYGLGGVGLAAGVGLVLWDAFRNPLHRAELVDGRKRAAGKKLKPLYEGPPR